MRGTLAAGVFLLLLGLGLGPGGCATARPSASGAATALGQYRSALLRDDAKAAYALLGKPIQQSLPYEQFAQQWQDTKEERAAQAAMLQQLLDHPSRPRPRTGATPGSPALDTRAVVTLPQGEQLSLQLEAQSRAGASSWQILDPDLQIIRAPTPQAALRLLLAAAEQRSYPALLRLLTRSERQRLEAELEERLARLRASLAHPPAPPSTAGSATAPTAAAGANSSAPAGEPAPGTSPTPDHVRIQYDPRFFIDLHREQDGWRIADFN